jgi:hypothetical protein
MLHRLNGPAIKSKSIYMWCKYNKRHNEIGPAVIIKHFDTIVHAKWYLNDKWMKTEIKSGIYVNHNADNPWSFDIHKLPYYVSKYS